MFDCFWSLTMSGFIIVVDKGLIQYGPDRCVISSIWLVTGIRQYRLIGSWKKRYGDYIIEKQEMDRRIASQYGGEDSSSD